MRKIKYLCVSGLILMLSMLSVGLALGQGTAIDNGVAWLETNQNTDGSWDGLPASVETPFETTSTVVDALYYLGIMDAAYLNAVGWIDGQDVISTRYLAQKIEALANSGADVTEPVTLLASHQNTDGSWGVAEGYSGDALDTLLSLRALRAANALDSTTTSKIVGWFLNNQNTDGGWGYTKGSESNVYVTSLVLISLSSYQTTYNIAANVDAATAWLLGMQNPDGSFGTSAASGAGTVFETALSYSALVRTAFAPAQTQNALAFIETAQLANGSWNDNAFETALALRALADGKANLTLSSSDIVFTPFVVYEGDALKITATVRNPSALDIQNAAVRFYLGAPVENVRIGADQVITQIPAGGAGLAEVSWNTLDHAGLNDIYVVIDPENTIAELNEADNEAHRTVIVRLKTVQLVDLIVSSEHVYFDPANPTESDSVVITGLVGNQGQADMNNVEVAFYDGDPSAGGALIGDIQVIGKIASGTYGQAQAAWDTTGQAGSHTIYVVTDPGDKITEADETNNSGSKTIAVAAIVNLPDLSITDISASQVNSDIVIDTTVSNKGLLAANNVLVKFYNGDPAQGGSQIGEDLISSLPSGASEAAQITWSPEAGEYEVYIVADPQDTITEGNELNNTGILTLAIGIARDLVVPSEHIYFSPQSPTEGEKVTILANVGNAGATTLENVEVAFYKDSVSAANKIGTTQIIQSIPAGSSASSQVSWNTIGLAGSHTIYVVADPDNKITEDDETNNTGSKSVTVVQIVNLPDLAITDITSSRVNGDILVSATVTNNGLAGAANITVRFFDGDPGQTGPQINGDQTIASLSAGASAQVQVTWTPTPGEHPIHIVIDPDNTVTESNELNNTGILNITIVSVVDLLVTQISFAPESPTEGDTVTVTGYIGNQGTKEAADVEVAFYDGDPAAGGAQIGATQTISVLGSGVVQSVNTAWDTTGQAGSHTIYLVVDPNNTIAEDDETNNTVSDSIAVVEKVDLPDFAITDMSFSNDWPAVSEQITITAQVTNKGLVSAANIAVRFYDGVPGEPGTVTIGDGVITSLAPDAVGTVQVNWTAAPQGEHKIYVAADPDNTIAEGNELNNSGYAEIGVGILPDLTISTADINFSHTDLTQGLKVIVSATVHNIGLATANTLVNFYDGDPIEANLLGQLITDPIQPQASQTLTFDWYPQAGVHTMNVELDPDNSIPEINETNNLASQTVEITIPETIVKTYKITDTEKIETNQFSAYEQLEVTVAHGWANALIFMEVLDSQGNSYYPPVPFLEGTAATRYWYTMNRPPSNYTLTVYIVDASTGYLIEAKDVFFTILPVFELKRLEAKVSPTFTYGGALQTVTISVGLTNASNISADLKIVYAMISPTGIVVSEGSGEKLLTLTPEQENPVIQLTGFDYQFTEAGDYTIQIAIFKDEIEILSEQSILTILPHIRLEVEKTISQENIFPGEDVQITTTIKVKGIDATAE